jgi:hypothetical protein
LNIKHYLDYLSENVVAQACPVLATIIIHLGIFQIKLEKKLKTNLSTNYLGDSTCIKYIIIEYICIHGLLRGEGNEKIYNSNNSMFFINMECIFNY